MVVNATEMVGHLEKLKMNVAVKRRTRMSKPFWKQKERKKERIVKKI